MYEQISISTTVLITLIVELIFSIAVPVTVLIIWKKKTDVSLSPALMGAAAFFIFAMVLKQLVHFLVIGLNENVSDFILSRPWLYAVYGGLTAGLFEETGRFLVFKTMMKKNIGRENAITYGIGHGGLECILILGMSMLSNLMLALVFNSMGAEEFIAQYAAEQADSIVASIQAINDVDILSAMLACFERVCAFILQIELSILVFAAVRLEKYWMFPLAILAHMGIDFFAALYQTGVLGSALLLEILLAVYVAALIIPIRRLYYTLPAEAPIELDHFGRPIRRSAR